MSGAMHKIVNEPDALLMWCPGCGRCHRVWVAGQHPCVWQWNGSMDKPTFHPSYKVIGAIHSQREECCHFFVRDGHRSNTSMTARIRSPGRRSPWPGRNPRSPHHDLPRCGVHLALAPWRPAALVFRVRRRDLVASSSRLVSLSGVQRKGLN